MKHINEEKVKFLIKVTSNQILLMGMHLPNFRFSASNFQNLKIPLLGYYLVQILFLSQVISTKMISPKIPG